MIAICEGFIVQWWDPLFCSQNQGPRSDLKVQGLSSERSEQNGGPGACSRKKFLRRHPLERWKMPFCENNMAI